MAEEITRERMREAIKRAKDIIAIGKNAHIDVTDAERLLGEACAASYRLDYFHARNLANDAAMQVIIDAVDDAYQRGVEAGREAGQMEMMEGK